MEDLDDNDVHFREDETMFLYCEEDQIQTPEHPDLERFYTMIFNDSLDLDLIVRILTMILPSCQV
jgi:hypothetical protein